MNLLCSVWCCVVTHSKQPLCALLICDCTFSYQPYLIWWLFHKQAKALPLCTCWLLSWRLWVIWNVCHFLWSLRCIFNGWVQVSDFVRTPRTTRCDSENLVRCEIWWLFLHSPPPTLISLHCAVISLRFRPPANGFVLLQTSIFLNTVHQDWLL